MEQLTAGLVTEIACAAGSWDEVERATVELLLDAIGGDTAFFAGEGGIGAHAQGVIVPLRDAIDPSWEDLGSGVEALVRESRRVRGAVVDAAVLGSALEQLPYYQTLMRPVRGRSTLIAFLVHRGCLLQKVAIGRCTGSSDFDDRDRALLTSIVPALTLARIALAESPRHAGPPRDTAFAKLTPREREVLAFLRLGYTNEQIALALGTRPRTVRNQLSRAYDKLGVANRAEAVGLALSAGALPDR